MRLTELRPIELSDLFRYYYFWNDFEKQFINRKSKENVDMDLFYGYANYMGITRNFKSGKVGDILRISEKYIKNNDPPSVEALSNILCESNYTHDRIKHVIVAASKILWFYDNATIIMDNNNKHVLKSLNHRITDYHSYCDAWRNCYDIKRIEITNIIYEHKIENLDEIFKREWFKKRIFDTYLWKLFKEKTNAT